MEYYRWNLAKYRKATRHLDPFQDGCYRRLIDEYMETREPLPDNDAALANICRIGIDRWLAEASSVIRAFFTPKDGYLFHDYCDSELDFQDGKTKFHTERAQKAAKMRWNKINSLDATSMLQAMLGDARERVEKDIKDKSLISGDDEKKEILPDQGTEKKKAPKKKQPVVLPDWVPAETWKAFLEHRQGIKKPMSEHAQMLAIRELENLQRAGHSPEAVINQSIMRGWAGLFELKNNQGNNNGHGTPKKTYSETLISAYEIAVSNVERKSEHEIY